MATIIPHHVVIIPDGNRRWARKQGMLAWQGHEAGAKTIEELVHVAREVGIRELSVWGSSLENLTKRPAIEVRELLKVYHTYFESILKSKEVKEGLVKIRVIGRFREKFPKKLITLLDKVMNETKEANQYCLNMFLAYSGDDDMLQAIEALSFSKSKVTRQSLKAALMTHELPPVDYMIRTGGDPHLSTGFMMWDAANAELFFTETLFPDFDKEAFKKAIYEYGERARRGGK
jgi:undecaprenyl diphosphate synthase